MPHIVIREGPRDLSLTFPENPLPAPGTRLAYTFPPEYWRDTAAMFAIADRFAAALAANLNCKATVVSGHFGADHCTVTFSLDA